jgi:hypothetical protein
MRRTLVGFASENELILHQTPPGFVMYDSQKMRRTLVGFWQELTYRNAPNPGGVLADSDFVFLVYILATEYL